MKLSSLIETILFVRGEPTKLERIVALTKSNESDVRAALEELRTLSSDRGIVLIENNGSYQLGSHPDHFSYVEEMLKNEFSEELSRSSLETLSIIAYKGPINRMNIEYVRGVNSSYILRNLAMRGLVLRHEDPHDARSYLYSLSADALAHFGLTRKEELPRYDELKKIRDEAFHESPPIPS